MLVSAWWLRAPRLLGLFRPSSLALGAMLLLASLRADASGPVFHERFEPDPAEDLAFGATVSGGKLPAVVQTRSGLVAAPDAASDSLRDGDVYGGDRTLGSVDATFRLDRLTSRPDRVHYDAPFRPSVIPFKRLYAFDRVLTSLHLGVVDERLVPRPVGGQAGSDEDVFFADLEVDLRASVPVRIPSVAPLARVRALSVEPQQEVEILSDGAENWFVRAGESGRVRLILELSADRRVFGDLYPPIAWEDLQSVRPRLPPEALAAAREVIQHIGLSRAESPAHALRILVDYFRRFRDSDVPPRALDPRDLYLELSLSRKGVCRHRAYAFLLTAQALGIPTRLVHNEAHAWVEVSDGELWYRIDLGGAAVRVDQPESEPEAITHRPPPDPFSWPEGGTPGRALSRAAEERRLEQRAANRSEERSPGAQSRAPRGMGPGDTASAESSDVEESSPGATSRPGPGVLSRLLSWEPDSARGPAVKISLSLAEPVAERGRPVRVSGRATRGDLPCALSRLDFFLTDGEATRVIGSVATDRNGYYLGRVLVPRDATSGQQEMGVRLGAGCGR